jgi:thioredoxin reductase
MGMNTARYDVVIVGGGPAGLSAALALGRARRRVLLCDAGERRNARATHIHNFVTRDGTPPTDFRAVGRDQLTTYRNVELKQERVDAIAGSRGAFEVSIAGRTVAARRVLLCTGMIDELPDVDGFAALWGHGIFQCPYCHGWEVQDRRWGYWPRHTEPGHVLPFALQALAWTRDLTVFTAGALELPADTRARLEDAGVRIVTSPIARLVGRGSQLEAVELAGGDAVPCDALFAHPPQRHVDLVAGLGLALDDQGYVRVDPGTRETSLAGVYAAGDLITRMQAAIHGAAAGTHAASMINVDLALDLAAAGPA